MQEDRQCKRSRALQDITKRREAIASYLGASAKSLIKRYYLRNFHERTFHGTADVALEIDRHAGPSCRDKVELAGNPGPDPKSASHYLKIATAPANASSKLLLRAWNAVSRGGIVCSPVHDCGKRVCLARANRKEDLLGSRLVDRRSSSIVQCGGGSFDPWLKADLTWDFNASTIEWNRCLTCALISRNLSYREKARMMLAEHVSLLLQDRHCQSECLYAKRQLTVLFVRPFD